MEKPNRENYYKDLEYFDKIAGEYFDNYLYIHDLEKYIKHLENKVNDVVLDDVIKCEYCGDVGRVEPTLQYPDGIKCYKCP